MLTSSDNIYPDKEKQVTNNQAKDFRNENWRMHYLSLILSFDNDRTLRVPVI